MTNEDLHGPIEEYLDGELSAAATAKFEGHLEACPACRGDLESARRLRRLALAAPEIPVPGDLGFRIRRRLREIEGLAPPRGRLHRLAPWLGGAVAAAALLLLFLPRTLAPPPPEGDSPLRPVAVAPGAADVDRVLSDWLLLAGNADAGFAGALVAEARELDLLGRVRGALADARGERRRRLLAGEDLLAQLENGSPGAFLAEEARLVVEVTR